MKVTLTVSALLVVLVARSTTKGANQTEETTADISVTSTMVVTINLTNSDRENGTNEQQGEFKWRSPSIVPATGSETANAGSETTTNVNQRKGLSKLVTIQTVPEVYTRGYNVYLHNAGKNGSKFNGATTSDNTTVARVE